jgi:hypothetical protein
MSWPSENIAAFQVLSSLRRSLFGYPASWQGFDEYQALGFKAHSMTLTPEFKPAPFFLFFAAVPRRFGIFPLTHDPCRAKSSTER